MKKPSRKKKSHKSERVPRALIGACVYLPGVKLSDLEWSNSAPTRRTYSQWMRQAKRALAGGV